MITSLLSHFASCPGGGFLGFPTWYSYLDGVYDAQGACIPKINGLADIWLILAAVIEMLLRVAALAALVFVIYGGVKFITSQGESEKTAAARQTVLNALGGLVLAVSAAAVVSFVAGRFH